MIRKMFVLALLIFMAAPGVRGQGGPNVIAFSSPMNIEFMKTHESAVIATLVRLGIRD